MLMPIQLPQEVQIAVDTYLALYRQSKEIEAKMKSLRGVIEPFLKQHPDSVLEAGDGSGKIELTSSKRPIMNAQYTTYNIEDISSLLPANILRKCTVQVVDKERLESLGKLGQIPEEVLALKQTRESVSFTCKLNQL